MTQSRPGRSRGARGGSAPWVAADHRTGEVRCALCGAANSASAGFCRWCGTPLGRPTDPVLGVTTRRALAGRQGNPLTSVIGVLLAVGLVGLATWAIMGGGLAGLATDASPSPRRSTALASPSGAASSVPGSVVPSIAPPPAASASLAPPASTSPQTPVPSAPPVPPPPTALPTDTGFTCDAASIGDGTSATWRLVRSRWGPRNGFDQVALILDQRRPTAGQASVVTVESVPSSEVEARFGLPAPSDGERAIVLSFIGPVQLGTPFVGQPGLSVLREVRVGRGSDGIVHAIIGVDGGGCHRLSAPGWVPGPPPQEAEIVLDVRP